MQEQILSQIYFIGGTGAICSRNLSALACVSHDSLLARIRNIASTNPSCKMFRDRMDNCYDVFRNGVIYLEPLKHNREIERRILSFMEQGEKTLRLQRLNRHQSTPDDELFEIIPDNPVEQAEECFRIYT